ncbi:MAG: ATP-dependent helicase/nuclease subunit A [Methanonatronarchaeales archaeon]|nr:ATP-dependent helicase/nuclease subunit A [Methanonatronarchaeales archaeon]
MADDNPNPEQREFIRSGDGVYLVDAGAGTGKTFALTRRYRYLLGEGYEPDDLLLATFTRNAASEMKERIISETEYDQTKLRDAPITTFHAFCKDLLGNHGSDAPILLGVDDRVTPSTRVVSQEEVEEELFARFVDKFSETYPKYHRYLQAVNDPVSLLDLIRNLSAKGVFPHREGWYSGETYLDGDLDRFLDIFDEANRPNEGKNGATQSDLRKWLGQRYGGDRTYLPEAPARDEVRGGRGAKSIDRDLAERAFHEDREGLKAFVHDVYFEYVRYALRRNYLNFGFIQMLTYALLREDHELREDTRFRHVMVDEFQDTSEIQFKLAMLLSRGNLCCVGDWKQSIYGFQSASVENILNFRRRLRRYRDELNRDAVRIDYGVEPVETIEFTRNYRSTQEILDLSGETLLLPATDREEIDAEEVRDRTVSLEAETDRGSRIEALRGEEEKLAVLEKIQEMRGNPEYAVERDGELVPPGFGDIAVLTRTNQFGRELRNEADELGVPMEHEGETELFTSRPALLLLAWLRILEEPGTRRGWSVALEGANYPPARVEEMLETGDYPRDVVEFREELERFDDAAAVARRVFDRYGLNDAYTDALLADLKKVEEETYMNRAEVVRYLERGIEQEALRDVDEGHGTDSVTVQTIHGSKGLEYPVVILADVNTRRFPSTAGGGSDAVRYRDPIGLRQTRMIDDAHGHPFRYHNWRHDVLAAPLAGSYDEERRLLYVAATRTQHHLVITAGENPSPLFTGITENHGIPVEEIEEPSPELLDVETWAPDPLEVEIPEETRPLQMAPHDLIDESVFQEAEGGRGREVGIRVHRFAERYARGEDVEPRNPDEENVARFVDDLREEGGELMAEVPVTLPTEHEGEDVVFSGTIDLLHLTDGAARIVDYKTDLDRSAEEEYGKQLDVYRRAVEEVYPGRDVEAELFYTEGLRPGRRR